jgi:hypothetical protein
MRNVRKNVHGIGDDSEPSASLFPVNEVEPLLQSAARAGHALSYSEALFALGYRFSRPKMRALCVVLSAIDQRAAARGQPELAVLVVRESDKLPGQGWWVGRTDYAGDWTGPAALSYVRGLQAAAYNYWRARAKSGRGHNLKT